jgi:hypothetical protein
MKFVIIAFSLICIYIIFYRFYWTSEGFQNTNPDQDEKCGPLVEMHKDMNNQYTKAKTDNNTYLIKILETGILALDESLKTMKCKI